MTSRTIEKAPCLLSINNQMNSRKISRPIVLASDEAYAMPLSTTLRSIVDTNRSRWPLDFHVLSDGISESTRKKILDSLPEDSATIRWVEVDLGLFQEFSTINHISKMTYARFLIPSIFPDTVSKVLYLDADILVLDDLSELWETDLDGAVIGAVLDGLDMKIKHGTVSCVQDFEKLPCVRNYFNGGVILIDLKQWRKNRISEKALEYLSRHPQSPYSDQDALNVACDGLWKKLDPRWNFHEQHYKNKIADLKPDEMPGIVHFVTCLKPWKPSSISLNASFYNVFRSRTRFARTPSEKQWEWLQGFYYRLKRILRQYTFLQVIWISVKSARN